jgi:catechol 2,3-dioxygenase-like lactoylglutathione lyase family enzyme
MANLTSEIRTNGPGSNVASGDTKLEVVVIPVSDVDRAKDFYTRLGWRLDGDFEDGWMSAADSYLAMRRSFDARIGARFPRAGAFRADSEPAASDRIHPGS